MHGQVGIHGGEWFGLPRSTPPLSLRRSGHDAGFVGGRDRSYNPLLLWILRTLFLLGVAACLGPLFGGDIR